MSNLVLGCNCGDDECGNTKLKIVGMGGNEAGILLSDRGVENAFFVGGEALQHVIDSLTSISNS